MEQLQTAPAASAGQGELAETVDVFGKNGIVRKQSAPVSGMGLNQHEKDFVSDSIESEIMKLREAESLIAQNKFNEGLNRLKVVENSTSRQVRVRAKFLLGEILFKQKNLILLCRSLKRLSARTHFQGWF